MPLGIVGRHDDGVGDDVLRHLRVHADLRHFAAELLVAVGIHRESHGHVEPDAADIGLVDRGPHLHPVQVLGDQEQAGGVQAATTVWPMLTRRSMIVPRTGDLMVQ